MCIANRSLKVLLPGDHSLATVRNLQLQPSMTEIESGFQQWQNFNCSTSRSLATLDGAKFCISPAAGRINQTVV